MEDRTPKYIVTLSDGTVGQFTEQEYNENKDEIYGSDKGAQTSRINDYSFNDNIDDSAAYRVGLPDGSFTVMDAQQFRDSRDELRGVEGLQLQSVSNVDYWGETSNFLQRYEDATNFASMENLRFVRDNADRYKSLMERYGQPQEQEQEKSGNFLLGLKQSGMRAVGRVMNLAAEQINTQNILHFGKDEILWNEASDEYQRRIAAGEPLFQNDEEPSASEKAKWSQEDAHNYARYQKANKLINQLQKKAIDAGENPEESVGAALKKASDSSSTRVLQDAANQIIENNSTPMKGWGRVGEMVPLIATSAGAVALAATGNPVAAKALGDATMAIFAASAAGDAMKQARDAGASTAQTNLAGLATAGIFFGISRISLNRAIENVFSSSAAKAVTSEALATSRQVMEAEVNTLFKDAVKNGIIPSNGAAKILGKEFFANWGKQIVSHTASFSAMSAMQALVPLIYEDPEKYPVLTNVLEYAKEGAVDGLILGAFTGGFSSGVEMLHRMKRWEGKDFVTIAEMHFNEGEAQEIYEYNPATSKWDIPSKAPTGTRFFGEVVGGGEDYGYILFNDGGKFKMAKVNENNVSVSRTIDSSRAKRAAKEAYRDEGFDQGRQAETPEQRETIRNEQKYQTAKQEKESQAGGVSEGTQLDVDRANAAMEGRRQAVMEGIQQRTGQQFWKDVPTILSNTSETGEESPIMGQVVDVVTLSNGNQVFVIAEDAQGLAYVDENGNHRTIDKDSQDIVSRQSYSLDEYLDSRVREEDAQAEQQRMQAEQAQNLANVQQALQEQGGGQRINIGTPEQENWIPIVDIDQNPNGGIAVLPEGAKEPVIYPWKQVASILGLPYEPKTSDDLVQERLSVDQKVDNYNNIPQGADLQVPVEGAEPQIYKFRSAELVDGDIIIRADDPESGQTVELTPDIINNLEALQNPPQEQAPVAAEEPATPAVTEIFNDPAANQLGLSKDYAFTAKNGEVVVNGNALWADNPRLWTQWNDLNENRAVPTKVFLEAKLKAINAEVDKARTALEMEATGRQDPQTMIDLRDKLTEKVRRQAEVQTLFNEYDAAEKALIAEQEAAAKAQKEAEDAAKAAAFQAELEAQRQEKARKEAEHQVLMSQDEAFKARTEKYKAAKKYYGRATKVNVNGVSYPAHFVLMDAFTPSPSFDVRRNFEPTEGFGVDEQGRNLNTRAYDKDVEEQEAVKRGAEHPDYRIIQYMPTGTQQGIMIDGSKRTGIRQLSAIYGTDGELNQEYRDASEQFGFTVGQVDEFEHPYIIKELDEPVPLTAKLFDSFNQSIGTAASTVALAAKVAKMTDDVLINRVANLFVGVDDIQKVYQNPETIKELFNILEAEKISPREDRPRYIDAEGKLTGAGEDFVESLLFGSIFSESDNAVRQAMADKSIRRAIAFAFPTLVRVRNLGGDYSIIGEMTDAVTILAQAKADNQGKPEGAIEYYLLQPDLFTGETPVVAATTQLLAQVLNDRKYGSLRKVLDQYITRAELANEGQMGFNFDGGEGIVETKEDILRDVLALNNINIQTYGSTGTTETGELPANDEIYPPAGEYGVSGTEAERPADENLAGLQGEGDTVQEVAPALSSSDIVDIYNGREATKEADKGKPGRKEIIEALYQANPDLVQFRNEQDRINAISDVVSLAQAHPELAISQEIIGRMAGSPTAMESLFSMLGTTREQAYKDRLQAKLTDIDQRIKADPEQKAALMEERTAAIQEFVDANVSVKGIRRVVSTEANLPAAMTNAGYSPAMVQMIMTAISEAAATGDVPRSFIYNKGGIFLITDHIKNAKSADTAHAHEEEHFITNSNGDAYKLLKMDGASRKNLLDAIDSWVGHKDFYHQMPDAGVANEFLSHAIERAKDLPEDKQVKMLAKAGIKSEEIVNLVKNRVNERRNRSRELLSEAGRRSGANAYDLGSTSVNLGQDGRNTQERSGRNLEGERPGIADSSLQGNTGGESAESAAGGDNASFSLNREQNGTDNQQGRTPQNQVGDRGDNGRVSEPSSRAVALQSDRGRIRVLEAESAPSSRNYSGDIEGDYARRQDQDAEGRRIIEAAKKNGLFIEPERFSELKKSQQPSKESLVYYDLDNNRVIKIKDPFAAEGMTDNIPFDELYQHIIHNLFFPESKYDFLGVTTNYRGDEVRFVLSQDYIESIGRTSDVEASNFVKQHGFKPIDGYWYENDDIVVADFYGANMLKDAYGNLHLIDPLIKFKTDPRQIIDKIIAQDAYLESKDIKYAPEKARELRSVDSLGSPKPEVISEIGKDTTEGTVLFSLDDDKTLVGIHNINAEKLGKAIRMGGLANPSAAVIDLSRQNHFDYGDISLIMPSSLVDKSSGENIGTYDRDAWTPTYPTIKYFESKQSRERLKELIKDLPKGLQYDLSYKVESYLNGDVYNSGLEYLFLKEKGMEVGMQRKLRRYPYATVDDFMANYLKAPGLKWGDSSGFMDAYRALSDEDRLKANVYMTAYGNPDAIQKINEKIENYGKKYPAFLEGYSKEKGFADIDSFLYNIMRDERDAGEESTGLTIEKAIETIKDKGLQEEFGHWQDKVIDSLGFDEKFFDGFTPSGNRRYKAHTLENVSAWMKKQGRNASKDHGLIMTSGTIMAKMAQKFNSLSQIRRAKSRLVPMGEDGDAYQAKIEDVRERIKNLVLSFWSEKISNQSGLLTGELIALDYVQDFLILGKDLDSVVENFNRTEHESLSFSDEERAAFNTLRDDIRKLPVHYFETKFERPVYLDEFAAAVVPSDTPADIKEQLKNDRLPVYEYDRNNKDSRRKAVLEASKEDGVMFSFIGEIGAERLDAAQGREDRINGLEIARSMEARNSDAKAIKLATGWEKGLDGKWRYEMRDFKQWDPEGNIEFKKRNPNLARYEELLHRSNMSLFYPESAMPLSEAERAELDELSAVWAKSPKDWDGEAWRTRYHNSSLLPDYIDDEELFSAYPQLRNIKVEFEDMPDNTGGYADEEENKIALNKKQRYTQGAPDSLVHEIQHLIQEYEGFSQGTNLEAAKNKAEALALASNPLDKSQQEFVNSVQLWANSSKSWKNTVPLENYIGQVASRIGEDYYKKNLAGKDYDALCREYNRLVVMKNRASRPLSELDVYKRTSGEVEARNVTRRRNIGFDDVRTVLAEETEDVARKDQILNMPVSSLLDVDGLTESLKVVQSKTNKVPDSKAISIEIGNDIQSFQTYGDNAARELVARYDNQDGEEYPWMSEGELLEAIEREISYEKKTEPLFALIDQYRRLDAEDLDEGRRDFSGGEKQDLFEKITDQLRALSEQEEVVMFSLTRSNRDTIESWLKKRSDLKEEDRAVVMEYLEELNDSRTQLAAAKWFTRGTIRLPEDMPKVEQAISVAGKAKVDPLKYDSPMALLDAHADFKPTEKRIDPNTVKTLHKVKEFKEQGIVIYDVDDSEESRQNMRQIINTHYGKDASPWCLLQGDGDGNLTDNSKHYWGVYNAYPKQVAFKDGKLLAFSANDSKEAVWWDRQDSPHDGIPVDRKIPDDELGRSATYELDADGLLANPSNIHKGNKQNGKYTEWFTLGDDMISKEENYVDGKKHGKSIAYRLNGLVKAEEYYENGEPVGEQVWYYDNGNIQSKGVYDRQGRLLRSESYWTNGQIKLLINYQGSKRHGLTKEWYENGEPLQSSNWKNGKREGLSESYYGNGRLKERTEYVNGNENGVQEYWSEDGILYAAIEYKDGKRHGTTRLFYSNGSPYEEKHYIDGKENGIHRHWQADGTLTNEHSMKDDQRHGPYKRFYAYNGAPLESSYFKNGQLDGVSKTWHLDGSLVDMSLYENGKKVRDLLAEGIAEEDADNIMFSFVTDEKTLAKLEKEPTITLYRAMAQIEGKLYPPMSTKEPNGPGEKGKRLKMRQPSELGRWERSDEAPDKAIQGEDGKWYFDLKKGNGGSVDGVLYNPYFHTSASPLNDQFSGAINYPELVTVAVEVPISEFSSGYKAEKAADSVGPKDWHSGTVTGQLGEGRQVVLSRWAKPTRIVPDSEVAAMIAPKLIEKKISVPSNVVTPALKAELEKKGVTFDGVTKAPAQKPMTREELINSDSFKKWFGDWENDPEGASKVVNFKGEPVVMYHGTSLAKYTNDYSEFLNEQPFRWFNTDNQMGAHFGTREQAEERARVRSMFDPGVVSEDYIYPVYLNVRNPIYISDVGDFNYKTVAPELLKDGIITKDESITISSDAALKRLLEEKGYDGFIYMNKQEGRGISVAVFESNQIKSADPETYDAEGNVIPLSERFNPKWQDIYFSFAGQDPKNGGIFRGKRFWSGSVNLIDGEIEEVHTYEEAKANDFHHSSYFSEGQVEKMDDEENAFFWVEDGKVYGNWRTDIDDRIIKRIKEQIKVNPSTNDIYFSFANKRQEIFVSNAEKSLDRIKMDKATPQQWLKMIEGAGGLKSGEDKWMGLSDWLKGQDKKTLTKQEVLDYINQNKIQIEETHYSELDDFPDEFKQKYPRFEEAFAIDSDAFHDTAYIDSVTNIPVAVEMYNESHEDKIGLDWDWEDPTSSISDEDYDKLLKYGDEILKEGVKRDIDKTRLEYTTEGLENNHEIALTVPTIEPWNTSDNLHFGDAGGGRAIAWIRFGDTRTEKGAGNAPLDVEYIGEEPIDKPHRAAINGILLNWKDSENVMRNERREDQFWAAKSMYENSLRDNYSAFLNDEQTFAAQTLASLDDIKEEDFRPIYEDGKRVLVIDEIQSNRHQEGRKKGYTDEMISLYKEAEKKAQKDWDEYSSELREKYNIKDSISYSLMVSFREKATKEEFQKAAQLYQALNTAHDEWRKVSDKVPAAPFEKNWHELAMKRMLRYAAENGYDTIAWTNGAQQAERYNIGKVLDYIYRNEDDADGNREFEMFFRGGDISEVLTVDNEGNVLSSRNGDFAGKTLSAIVGKDMAVDMMNLDVDEDIDGDSMTVGAEGMKDFYDEMLPRFMNKYGKMWGVSVKDMELPIGETGKEVMHAVEVTPEMKESVMEGQLMFSMVQDDKLPVQGELFGEDNEMVRYESLGGLPKGEERNSLVERTFRKTGAFSFTGKEKIESAADVAYIFKELENSAVENAFLVFIKDGVPTIIHAGIGDISSVNIDTAPLMVGIKDFAPDEIYMVHNHPSGRVEASAADLTELHKIQEAAESIPVKGIVIDTISGEYGQFDDNILGSTLVSNRPVEQPEAIPLEVFSFDKMVFAPDYHREIGARNPIKSSEDVASYLSAHRLGEGAKINALLLDKQNKVVANLVLNTNEITRDNAREQAKNIVDAADRSAASSVIVNGDFGFDKSMVFALKNGIDTYGVGRIKFLDMVKVDGMRTQSLAEGTLREGEDFWADQHPETVRQAIANKTVHNVVVDTSITKLPTTWKEAIPIVDAMKKPFINDDQQVEIGVSHTNIKHTAIQDNSHEKIDVRCLGVIDQIIKNAVKIGNDKIPANEVGKTHAVEIYYCPVRIDGDQHSARLVVKEFENRGKIIDGLHLYDLSAKKRKPNAVSRGTGTKALTPSSASGSDYKVKDLIHSTKTNDQKLLGIKGGLLFDSGNDLYYSTRDNDIKAVENNGKSGFAQVIGEDNLEPLYNRIYRAIPKDILKPIVGDAVNDGLNIRRHLDKYLHELAKNGTENDETGLLRALYSEVRAYSGNPDLTDNDIRYMIWKATSDAKDGDMLSLAEDIATRRRWGVGEDEPMFSMTRDFADVTDEARERYETKLAEVDKALKEEKAGLRKSLKDELNPITKAMSAQKTYDKATVDGITKFAKQVLKSGKVDALTLRETNRLLSLVNGANGKSPAFATRYSDQLLDLLLDHIVKKESDDFKTLVNVKDTATNQTGVETLGKIDLRGQITMKAFRDSRNLSDKEIEDKVIDVSDRLSDPSDAVRERARAEYEGLALAQDYKAGIAENLKEAADLEDEIEYTKEAKKTGNIDKKTYDEYVRSTQEAIRENKMERVDLYREFRKRLVDVIAEGTSRARLFREANQLRIEAIHHDANRDMQGVSANEHRTETRKERLINSDAARFFLKPLATFDQMLRVIGRKNMSGEGYLWDRYMRGWVDSAEKSYSGLFEATEELDNKVSEVFGRKMIWSDLYGMERKMPGATMRFMDGGKMVEHELTPGNLLYIYMVNKMVDGKMKLRKMGISEDDVTAIKNSLDPRFIQLADWIQEDFLVGKRNKYNAVHERMFGAPMADIQEYFPLKILANARIEEVDLGSKPDGSGLSSTSTGSIIKRRKNALALDLLHTDAFSLVIEHLQQMEDWAAFAEYRRDLNTLLSYKRFRNQLQNLNTIYGTGKTLWNNFKDAASIASGSYRPKVGKGDLDTVVLNVSKGVTAAKITFRVNTALKQILSAPAYLPEVNMADLGKALVKPGEAWRWCMENLPVFRKRWKSRLAGDTRLMDTESDWKIWRTNVVHTASRMGMAPNAFVDAATIAVGAKAIYDTKYRRYIEDGLSELAADRKAKQDATILYNQTQQSEEGPFVSPMQLDRTFLSVMLSTFRNASFGYQRQLHDALRGIAREFDSTTKEERLEFMKKQRENEGAGEENARSGAEREYNRQKWRNLARVAIFGFGLQLLWNLGSDIWYLLFGKNDRKKKKLLDDATLKSLAGPIEGLAGGSVISDAWGSISSGEGTKYIGMGELPIVSDIKQILQEMEYDQPAAVQDIVFLVAQSGLGVNPETLTDTVVAIIDACNGDFGTAKEAALLMMRIAQIPQSTIDEFYIDELETSARKAKRMSPKQLAKRYADYKMNKEAPLTQGLYDDKTKERRRKAYENRINKKIKERK